MTVTFLGETLFHMDPRYMWISVLDFAIERQGADHELLGSLVSSPFYAHSYASPLGATDEQTDPAIHGPWERDRITVDRFKPCTMHEASGVLKAWANDQDWSEPTFKQPADAQARLDKVIEMFVGTSAYRLVNPGDEDLHDWGEIVGALGFHEFVLINRPAGRLRLIVASDD